MTELFWLDMVDVDDRSDFYAVHPVLLGAKHLQYGHARMPSARGEFSGIGSIWTVTRARSEAAKHLCPIAAALLLRSLAKQMVTSKA